MGASARWLPGDIRWIARTSERLIDGETLLLRGLPRGGKTQLCDAVASEIGPSSYVVRGASVDERNQAATRTALLEEIEARIEEFGCAQLIFDDYGKAVRRSQGGQLHSLLYGLLIDGPHARDIGALLTSRYADDLDLRFAGSPVLSRAALIWLPESDSRDANELGLDLEELRQLAGDSATFARRMLHDETGASSVAALVEYLHSDRRALVADLPAEVVEVMLGARAPEELSSIGRRLLALFGTVDDHKFRPARAISESGVFRELQARSPGWPSERQRSVECFEAMLAGAETALWVDRYLFAFPRELGSFLRQLGSRTGTRLRLLGADDRDTPDLAEQVRSAVAEVDGVEARTMTWADRRDLHDRHLVLPATYTGFMLPTAGVIVGCHMPGSAVSVRMPGLAVNYEDYWRRARPLYTT